MCRAFADQGYTGPTPQADAQQQGINLVVGFHFIAFACLMLRRLMLLGGA